MTITETPSTTSQATGLASNVQELEFASTNAYQDRCGAITSLGGLDLLIVIETDFPKAYDYVIQGWKLLAGTPFRMDFACGPTWAIPINGDQYIGQFDDLQYECVGLEVTHGRNISADSPEEVKRAACATDEEAGEHLRCQKCSGVLFAVPCVVCAYVWADTPRQR